MVNVNIFSKLNHRNGKVLSKTSGTIATFYVMKFAVVARLSEGEARVSKPQANKSIK